MHEDEEITNDEISILIYQTDEGNMNIDVRLENGSVWVSQKIIEELYHKGIKE